MIMTKEEIYTPQEAGAILRVSVYTIREMLKQGALRGFKVGTKWRIPASAVQELKGESDENK